MVRAVTSLLLLRRAPCVHTYLYIIETRHCCSFIRCTCSFVRFLCICEKFIVFHRISIFSHSLFCIRYFDMFIFFCMFYFMHTVLKRKNSMCTSLSHVCFSCSICIGSNERVTVNATYLFSLSLPLKRLNFLTRAPCNI